MKKTVNKSILNLKKNIFGFIANLAIGQAHRGQILTMFQEKEYGGEEEISKWEGFVKELRYFKKAEDNF